MTKLVQRTWETNTCIGTACKKRMLSKTAEIDTKLDKALKGKKP